MPIIGHRTRADAVSRAAVFRFGHFARVIALRHAACVTCVTFAPNARCAGKPKPQRAYRGVTRTNRLAAGEGGP
jgi:hypothetical protein